MAARKGIRGNDSRDRSSADSLADVDGDRVSDALTRRHRTLQAGHAVLAIGLVFLLTIFSSYLYTRYEVDNARRDSARAVKLAEEKAAEDLRHWCALIVTLDGAYNNPAQPPATELGRTVAREMHELRIAFDCK